MIVTEVKPHPKNDQWRVVVADGKDYICFSGAAADGLELGKPLPDGTTEDPPKFEGAMPSLKIPKKGGFGGGAPAAFRNTREGFLLEQRSIHRSVALQRAVEFAKGSIDYEWVTGIADEFFAWLSETAGGTVAPASVPPAQSSVGASARPVHPVASTEHVGGAVEAKATAVVAPPATSGAPDRDVPEDEWGPAVDLGEGVTAGPHDAAHIHEWRPAPREGWVLCACGKAEKAEKVRA